MEATEFDLAGAPHRVTAVGDQLPLIAFGHNDCKVRLINSGCFRLSPLAPGPRASAKWNCSPHSRANCNDPGDTAQHWATQIRP